jgi:hypothetical protein
MFRRFNEIGPKLAAWNYLKSDLGVRERIFEVFFLKAQR